MKLKLRKLFDGRVAALCGSLLVGACGGNTGTETSANQDTTTNPVVPTDNGMGGEGAADSSEDLVDTDGDGIPDAFDAFPNDPNEKTTITKGIVLRTLITIKTVNALNAVKLLNKLD